MPRQARLDSPGTLHHVILRGMERGQIVGDDSDRMEFLGRLGRWASETKTQIYAWAILRNHAHILLRSGPAGLSQFMRRFLTGYANYFNRRHRRHGHLFQNRYKSIVCQEDIYFRELVRYIHLNPLRARLVPDLRALERYPWSGHATLVGRHACPWQDRDYVLGWFGGRQGIAVREYRKYVHEGISKGRRPELVGGGLVRSLGGWAEVRAVRRLRQPVLADPRILGSGAFVEQLIQRGDERIRAVHRREERQRLARIAIAEECRKGGVSLEEMRHGSRRHPLPRLRRKLAVRAIEEWALTMADAARELGVSTSGIAKMVRRHPRK
jgi:putative transposase